MSIFANAPVLRSAGDYIDVTRWNAEVYTKLNEIDALFNYATGHDHSEADKGKQIALASISGHTKAVHDSLALDHGALSGRGDDDHTQYLRHAAGTTSVRIQGGKTTVNFDASPPHKGILTFTDAFSTACLAIICTSGGTTFLSTSTLSKTNVWLYMYNRLGEVVTGDQDIRWIAIGN